jgi:hypothetical protein
MKLNFKVDKDIIAGAVKGSTCECLVARALFREGVRNLKVTKDSVRGSINGSSIICPVPPKVAKAIEDFDKGKKIKAFSGTLNVGTLTLKKTKKKYAKSVGGKKRGPKKNKSTWSKYRYQGVAQLSKEV